MRLNPSAMNQPLRLAESLPSPESISFEDFFDREKAGLYGALCLVVHDRHEAEDLTQDAFVRIFERWDRVSLMDDPRGYLYRTAMNVFRSRYRRAMLALKRSTGAAPNDDLFAEVEARDATVRALATLSPRHGLPWCSRIYWASDRTRRRRCSASGLRRCGCMSPAPMRP